MKILAEKEFSTRFDLVLWINDNHLTTHDVVSITYEPYEPGIWGMDGNCILFYWKEENK